MRRRDDAGFTLIELLVATAILPLVMGAIAFAFVEVLSLHGTVSNRILSSADAQTVSANFENDVHSALQVTTSNPPGTQCGTGTQLLGLRWNLDSTGAYQTTVSYVKVTRPSGSAIVRNYCVAGSHSPSTSNEVAVDVPADQGPPTIAPAGSASAATAGWTTTHGMTGVTFSIAAPGSSYPYTLVGDPSTNGTDNPGGTPTPPNTTCGFANPGTGTYASNLCFVDFSGFTTAGKPTAYCPLAGQSEIDAGVINTPFTLQFCVSFAGTTVKASIIPTYTYTNYGNGVTSEAFLGNNGFYAGIPGRPALYQQTSGNTTVSITKIRVLDAAGNPASGWQLVTGDAESTDDREGMIWTTCSAVTAPGTGGSGELNWNPGYQACPSGSSHPVFHLLPNSSNSDFGNACHAPGGAAGWSNFRFSGAAYTNILTGAASGSDTNTVQCFATTSSDKTGTVMLAAAAPKDITAWMHGDGKEAVFVGLLLP